MYIRLRTFCVCLRQGLRIWIIAKFLQPYDLHVKELDVKDLDIKDLQVRSYLP